MSDSGPQASVRLPVLVCRRGWQPAGHIGVIAGPDELVRPTCALDRASTGAGQAITSMPPASRWGGTGAAARTAPGATCARAAGNSQAGLAAREAQNPPWGGA